MMVDMAPSMAKISFEVVVPYNSTTNIARTTAAAVLIVRRPMGIFRVLFSITDPFYLISY
jgi:hypothetical protein